MKEKTNFIESGSRNELTDEFLMNSLDHNVLIEKNDGKFKYKLKIAVGSFVPTDFKLKLKNQSLLIKATRELNNRSNINKKNEKHVSNLVEYEEFKREIYLPEFVLTDTLTCYLEVYEDNKNFLFLEGLIDPSTDVDILTNYVEKKNKTNKVASNVLSETSNVVNMRNINRERKPRLEDCSTHNSKVFKSIDQIGDKRVENYSNNGCLKYKFDLRDFDSDSINISIRNKNILVVHAYDTYLDLNGKPAIREFNQEINLPNNIELCNIRNCFDETLGILRIEIPLLFSTSKKENKSFDKTKPNELETSTSDDNQEINDKDDKYLELMFDLKDFKYDSVEFYKNKDEKNVLVVKAVKESNSDETPFIRKYALPDWVSTEDIKIFEENKLKDGIKKNFLILNLPFV